LGSGARVARVTRHIIIPVCVCVWHVWCFAVCVRAGYDSFTRGWVNVRFKVSSTEGSCSGHPDWAQGQPKAQTRGKKPSAQPPPEEPWKLEPWHRDHQHHQEPTTHPARTPMQRHEGRRRAPRLHNYPIWNLHRQWQRKPRPSRLRHTAVRPEFIQSVSWFEGGAEQRLWACVDVSVSVRMCCLCMVCVE
jgi:hypothetical protein